MDVGAFAAPLHRLERRHRVVNGEAFRIQEQRRLRCLVYIIREPVLEPFAALLRYALKSLSWCNKFQELGGVHYSPRASGQTH